MSTRKIYDVAHLFISINLHLNHNYCSILVCMSPVSRRSNKRIKSGKKIICLDQMAHNRLDKMDILQNISPNEQPCLYYAYVINPLFWVCLKVQLEFLHTGTQWKCLFLYGFTVFLFSDVVHAWESILFIFILQVQICQTNWGVFASGFRRFEEKKNSRRWRMKTNYPNRCLINSSSLGRGYYGIQRRKENENHNRNQNTLI